MSAVSSICLKTAYTLLSTGRVARRQSRFKALFTAAFVVSFEGGLFALFLSGFRFLTGLGPIGPMIIHSLFSLFFFGLGAMLVISSVLSSYATMYRSSEVPFLLVRPYAMSHVVVYKFLESCFLSSWAFFFIVLPFVGAYALHEHRGLPFVFWTFMFSVPFVIICSGLGTILTMVFVRWTPGGVLFKVMAVSLLVVCVVGIWATIHTARAVEDDSRASEIVLTRLVPGLRLSSHPLLPSWWVSEGIAACGRGSWGRASLFLLFVWSNALMVSMVVETIGKRVFYGGWQKVIGATGRTVIRRPMLEPLNRFLGFLPHDIRAIIVKDARMLLRDPMQWSQFLIFFGLLGLYFASLRQFRYDSLTVEWRSVMAFLNMFSVATVLCSLSSRFIYPQISLEGQSFWVLGLSPTSMGRILATKFGIAVAGLTTVSLVLMFLSTRMLRLDTDVQIVAVALAVSTSVGISGMSTGLGAVFLDLKERNPVAIVSGFGGTLNLVLGLCFMLATVLPFAAVYQLHVRALMGDLQFARWVAACIAWLVILTAAATIVPMAIGRKSLMAREY